LLQAGLPLGIKPDAEYREGRTQLQCGDVLVIYSDGVTEAVSPTGEEFWGHTIVLKSSRVTSKRLLPGYAIGLSRR
jgi:sigma-B regulation protein RsbU (phosphoserine phosphatase)